MEVIEQSAFFEVLRAGRAEFNERFAMARRAGLRVDEEQFSEVLRELVGPVVEAVSEVDEMAALATTRVLFEVALKLVSLGLLGQESRHFQINGLWMSELPKLASFLVEEPERVVSALSNAVHNLASSREGDAALWRQYLLEVAPGCSSADELLRAGKVLAWRSGMAHFRESALSEWESLSEGLKYEVMGVSEEVGDVADLRRRLQNRWTGAVVESLSDEPQVVGRVGGFRGAGGVFVEPPCVGVRDGELFAFDREGVFSLHADVYGTSCKRASPAVLNGLSVESFEDMISQGTNELSGLPEVFEEPTSVARTEDTLALSLGHSHFIYLVARGSSWRAE